MTTGEDDALGAAAGVDPGRDLDTVRDDLVMAGREGSGGQARLLGDGDPQVDPAEQQAPQRLGEPTPGRVPGRVEGRDGRPIPERERGRAEHRRERLVHVDEVEALAGERTAELHQRVRAQHEVRERAVAGHDHGPAERDHTVGRRPGPSGARVKDAAERAGRIVPDQQARLDPHLGERACLRLGVVDDAAAERPRVGDDDPDLHPGEASGDAPQTGPRSFLTHTQRRHEMRRQSRERT